MTEMCQSLSQIKRVFESELFKLFRWTELGQSLSQIKHLWKYEVFKSLSWPETCVKVHVKVNHVLCV